MTLVSISDWPVMSWHVEPLVSFERVFTSGEPHAVKAIVSTVGWPERCIPVWINTSLEKNMLVICLEQLTEAMKIHWKPSIRNPVFLGWVNISYILRLRCLGQFLISYALCGSTLRFGLRRPGETFETRYTNSRWPSRVQFICQLSQVHPKSDPQHKLPRGVHGSLCSGSHFRPQMVFHRSETVASFFVTCSTCLNVTSWSNDLVEPNCAPWFAIVASMCCQRLQSLPRLGQYF